MSKSNTVKLWNFHKKREIFQIERKICPPTQPTRSRVVIIAQPEQLQESQREREVGEARFVFRSDNTILLPCGPRWGSQASQENDFSWEKIRQLFSLWKLISNISLSYKLKKMFFYLGNKINNSSETHGDLLNSCYYPESFHILLRLKYFQLGRGKHIRIFAQLPPPESYFHITFSNVWSDGFIGFFTVDYRFNIFIFNSIKRVINWENCNPVSKAFLDQKKGKQVGGWGLVIVIAFDIWSSNINIL